MTTSHATHPFNVHKPIGSGHTWRRLGMLAAGVALSVGAVGVANQVFDTSPQSVRATTDAVTNAPTSALLDGPAFAAAIDQAVAGIEAPQSVLLDGDAFAAAINQAMADTEG